MPKTNDTLEDIRRIRRELAKLKNIKITVGVQAAEGLNIHGNNVSADDELIMIAGVHEYGCTVNVTNKMRAFLHYIGLHLKESTEHINIPERSFVRSSYEAGQTILSDVAKKTIADLLQGKIDAMGVAVALGKAAVELTVGMLGADAKPLKEFSAERRKDSKTGAPLHDTGNLLNHITYHIEGGVEND